MKACDSARVTVEDTIVERSAEDNKDQALASRVLPRGPRHVGVRGVGGVDVDVDVVDAGRGRTVGFRGLAPVNFVCFRSFPY